VSDSQSPSDPARPDEQPGGSGLLEKKNLTWGFAGICGVALLLAIGLTPRTVVTEPEATPELSARSDAAATSEKTEPEKVAAVAADAGEATAADAAGSGKPEKTGSTAADPEVDAPGTVTTDAAADAAADKGPAVSVNATETAPPTDPEKVEKAAPTEEGPAPASEPKSDPAATPDDVTAAQKSADAPTAEPAARDEPTAPPATTLAEAEPGPSSYPDVTPSMPWKPLANDAALTRIAIGSCLSQRHPQPIWSGVLGLKQQPDLFMMLGDNVYGDVKGPDMSELVVAYRDQADHPEFAKARAAFPFLATWDDHDYGTNDGGADFPHREAAARLFFDFWDKKPPRDPEDGIYHARVVGPEGQRVQFIMLDTRSFRSPLTRKGSEFPHWGRYEPSKAEQQSMLGDAQWAWFEEQLQEPADIRIIASSVQVLAEGHGFERWGNLPAERKRLMDLLSATGAKGTILVSGDRHAGALYKADLKPGLALVELTSSSLNRSYGPSRDAKLPVRLSPIYHQENFGLIDIDWAEATVTLSLRGMDGNVLYDTVLPFAALGLSAS